MPFTLTAFADEVSPDLDAQLAALVEHGVTGIDVRSIGGVNVLDLTLEDLEQAKEKISAAGRVVSCVGSPVNKVAFDTFNRATELKKLERACYAADRLNTKKIRIFTPEVPEGQHDAAAEGVLDWMGEQKRLAADRGKILLHENDARFWGAYPENAKRLFGELADDNFRAAFDFANTILLGFRPRADWLTWITPFLDTLHIKDAIRAEGKVVPAGGGDGEMAAALTDLVAAGWSGPLTLEPHLQAAGPLGGFSGEQLFATAVGALKKVMTEAGVTA